MRDSVTLTSFCCFNFFSFLVLLSFACSLNACILTRLESSCCIIQAGGTSTLVFFFRGKKIPAFKFRVLEVKRGDAGLRSEAM